MCFNKYTFWTSIQALSPKLPAGQRPDPLTTQCCSRPGTGTSPPAGPRRHRLAGPRPCPTAAPRACPQAGPRLCPQAVLSLGPPAARSPSPPPARCESTHWRPPIPLISCCHLAATSSTFAIGTIRRGKIKQVGAECRASCTKKSTRLWERRILQRPWLENC